MSQVTSQFAFVTCRVGAESALKLEIARCEPEWRVAFSRPGFVTFKLPAANALDEQQLAERNWTLARAHGFSLGKVTGESLTELAGEVWRLADGPSFADVHVWERDARTSDEDEYSAVASPLAAEIEQAIRAAAPAASGIKHIDAGERRKPSPKHSRVLDVVLVEPNEWWIGSHRVVTPQQRWPGGAIPVRTPEHAVSRAYTKMAEALAWSGLPIEDEDEWVELGCAPGGACQALLDRGMFVTGIDPAEVDPQLLAHPRFRHLRKRSKEVRRNEFLGVRWLAADMNLAPNYTLDAVEAVIKHPGVHIRGMVLTLKLGDWEQAEQLAECAARVRGWGYRDVRMRQLSSGGQEVCLVALRRKALRRLSGKRQGGKKAAAKGGAIRQDPPHQALSGPHFYGTVE
ncbi:MAG: SAM-dependent methyltransferase [Pirellulales bacterium]